MTAAVEPAASDQPPPDRRGLRRVGAAPKLAEKLAAQAAEAADLRALATNPDVVALRVERIRRQVDVMAWSGIVLGLGFTMVNVQTFAARGAAPWSLPWSSAWLLDPMVSLFVIALLRTQQVCARWQVRPGPWVRRGVWAGLAATYAMNTWTAWVTIDPSLILLHSVPVVVVAMGAEALTDAREALTQAILVAARPETVGDQPSDVEAAQPSSARADLGGSPVQPGRPGDLVDESDLDPDGSVAESQDAQLAHLPAALYRLRDRAGCLLYVGASTGLRDRLMSHRKHKDWWDEVATVDVVQYATRKEALVAEWFAIRDENPLHNGQSGRGGVHVLDGWPDSLHAGPDESFTPDQLIERPVAAPVQSPDEVAAKDAAVREWVAEFHRTHGRPPGRDVVKREHRLGTNRAERLIEQALAPLASSNGAHR